MERRNNGTGRMQLPKPERMDIRKHTRTRKVTTRPNNSQGHHTSTKNTQPGYKTSWEKRPKLETEIPWREIGRNIGFLSHGIDQKKHELIKH